MTFAVKILPFIIGAVFNMVLGALWYSKVLFAKPWMKEAGIKEEDINASKGKMAKVYICTTVLAFATSYIIGVIIANMGIASVGFAILAGVFFWIAFSLPMVIKNWGFEGRSIKLGLINHGYELVIYIVVAILYVVL